MVARIAARICMMVLFVTALTAGPTLAQTDDANKILKAMSDYLGSQKNLSASFDTDIEVITPQIEKIQFASSGQVEISRPDKFHGSRVGGYADVEITFDGKTATIYGKHANGYVQVSLPGSVDQFLDQLSEKFGVALPGADLLSTSAYDVLTSDVISGAHIGRGVIGGIECEHLAFRGRDTDWQIWIQRGNQPLPRKYVITSKAVAAAPQYTVVIRDWKIGVEPNAKVFVFTPPQGAKQFDVRALASFDEVPPEAVKGGQK
jgi:hypothetical protein